MLVDRRGREPETWIEAARAGGIAPLAGFYQGWDAVLDGRTLPCGSGVVDGHVDLVEMIKRQMYGRAGLHPLRERILYPG